jgi:hypothetical protein
MLETPKFSHEVDHRLCRLTTITAGPFAAQDVAEHLAAREAEGAMEYSHLADLRQSRITIETGEMQWLAREVQRKAKTFNLGKTAFLVGDPYTFGMLRMFCTLAEPDYTGNVLRSRAEALEWLGWELRSE